MKWILILSFFLAMSHIVSAQDTITFYPGDYQIIDARLGSVTPLYEKKGDVIFYRNDSVEVMLPDNLNWKDTAFGFLYFAGCEKAKIDRIIIFFIGNRTASTNKLLIDYNGNLDLTDDEPPLSFTDSLIIALPNSENGQGKMHYHLQRNRRSDESNKNNWNFYSSKSTAINNQILPLNYWLHDIRLNTRIADTIIDNQRFLIGLHDYNVNGLFNDSIDRILSGNSATGFISESSSQGAEDYSDTALIKQNGEIYRVVEIDPYGNYFKIVKSDLPYLKLRSGDLIPNFKFTDVDSNTFQLYDLLDSSKYTLIDVWGQWCHGCISQFPKLKTLSEVNKNKLQVIGLNIGDERGSAKNFMKEKGDPWFNGIITSEIHDRLSIDAYPFYVLIAPDGRIVKLYIFLNEVQEILDSPELKF